MLRKKLGIKEFSLSENADIIVVSTVKKLSNSEQIEIFESIRSAWRKKFRGNGETSVKAGNLIYSVGPFDITELSEHDLNLAGWYKRDLSPDEWDMFYVQPEEEKDYIEKMLDGYRDRGFKLVKTDKDTFNERLWSVPACIQFSNEALRQVGVLNCFFMKERVKGKG